MGKRVRINGVVGEIVTPQEIEAEAAKGGTHPYVLVRVADVDPGAGSPQLRARRRRVPCEGCQEICWYDPDAAAQFAVLKLEWLCAQCVTARLRLQRALGGR